MISALMVSRDKLFFSGIKSVLAQENIKTVWCPTGEKALSMLSANSIDLIIIDETLPDMTGRQFIETVVIKNPMTNCVVASPLSKKEFHEAYEGLGVLMQFPVISGEREAWKLLERSQQIFNLQTPKTSGNRKINL